VSNTATPTATQTKTPTPQAIETATSSPTSTISPSSTATITQTPVEIDLNGNKVLSYPNPGKDNIRFSLSLTESKTVSISLFNLAGERVAKLQEILPAGTSSLDWECSTVSPGLYIGVIFMDGEEYAKVKLCVTR
jgi:type IX secretion system substrate protein